MPTVGQVIEVHHVFLSSPGDMEEERNAVREFFDSFNGAIGRLFGIRFEVVDWKNYTDIGLGNPQDLITEQTLERFSGSLALVIGLMGQRFGTPTGKFESGTQAEFEWAASHREKHGHPEIKWFFKRIDQLVFLPREQGSIQNTFRQWKRVQRFRRDYKGLYTEFEDTASFSQLLREDLFRWFSAWIAKRRTIGPLGKTAPTADLPEVPDFLDNRLSRTLHIVTALEEMLDRLAEQEPPCLRICAVMSSLAISRDNAWVQPGDEDYLQLIERERDLIWEMFERGASLRVLLTWNVKEMLEWQLRTREDVLQRLARLRSFCEKTLTDDSRVNRAQLVHIGIRERNLLILGNKCVFEGRKLSTKAGFEATQLITDKRRVAQEIEMFDILFSSAVENECANFGLDEGANLNRRLIELLMRRIDRDTEELKVSRDAL